MAVTWRFLVDWNRDGDFSDADENITQYVMRANWNVGYREALEDIAGENECTLTLRNTDKRFSPEGTAGPYYGKLKPLRPLRVESVNAGGTAVHYAGWIDDIQPTWNERGELTAFITATGPKKFFEKRKVYLDLMENVRADQVIEEVLRQVKIPPAGNVWALGIAGHSELGQTTYLANLSIPRSLETGKETFPFVGDAWEDGVDAYSALQAAVRSERGRLFFNRGGTAIFWNRHHLILDASNDGTVNVTMQGMDYAYGDLVSNNVKTLIYPRSITANAVTLWRLDEPLTIRAGMERTVRATFKEQNSDAKIAGRDVIPPSASGGTLVVSSGSVEMTNFEADARSAKITLKAGAVDAVVSTLEVKGRKITTFNKLEIEERDGQSEFDYGKRELTIDMDLTSSETSGEAVARYEVARRKTAFGRARRITLHNDDENHVAMMLNRTVGDRIKVIENQTQHNADYFIVGEEHLLQDGLRHHVVDWTLEPVESNKFWLLGVAGRSELGKTTVVGPL